MNEGKKLTVQDFNHMRMERYGKAIQTEGLTENDQKWIGYFNDEVGKIFHKKKNQNNPDKIGSQYILKQLWKGWTSFIAMKYIDIGKAVYLFAMPHDINPKDGTTVAYGVVQDDFKDGLTSFDYEQIKAKETIARELAGYTTFAANIFSRATVEERYLEGKNKDDAFTKAMMIGWQNNQLLDEPLIYKDVVNKDIEQYLLWLNRLYIGGLAINYKVELIKIADEKSK